MQVFLDGCSPELPQLLAELGNKNSTLGGSGAGSISLDFSIFGAHLLFTYDLLLAARNSLGFAIYNFRKRPLPWPITIACKGAPFYSYEFILSSVAVYLFPIYFSHLLTESSILADSFTVNMSKPVWGARGTAGFLTLAPVLSNISSVFGVRFFGVSI